MHKTKSKTKKLSQDERNRAIFREESIQSGLFKMLLYTASDMYHRNQHDVNGVVVDDFLTPEECDGIFTLYCAAGCRLADLRDTLLE